MPVPRRPWTEAEDELLRQALQSVKGPRSTIPWHIVAKAVPGRTNKDCRKRWHGKVACQGRKGVWTVEENRKLIEAVGIWGTRWSLVAQHVGTRTGDQCAKRWTDSLNPEIKRCPWTEEEDSRLLDAVDQMGFAWSQIVAEFPGRTGLAAKNRYDHLRRALKAGRKRRASTRIVETGTGSAARHVSQPPPTSAPSPVMTSASVPTPHAGPKATFSAYAQSHPMVDAVFDFDPLATDATLFSNFLDPCPSSPSLDPAHLLYPPFLLDSPHSTLSLDSFATSSSFSLPAGTRTGLESVSAAAAAASSPFSFNLGALSPMETIAGFDTPFMTDSSSLFGSSTPSTTSPSLDFSPLMGAHEALPADFGAFRSPSLSAATPRLSAAVTNRESVAAVDDTPFPAPSTRAQRTECAMVVQSAFRMPAPAPTPAEESRPKGAIIVIPCSQEDMSFLLGSVLSRFGGTATLIENKGDPASTELSQDGRYVVTVGAT